MRSILIAAGVVTLIPLLLFAALLFLLSNPDFYRDTLTRAVEAQTGYSVTIGGDMNWRYLPPIALEIENVEVRPVGASTALASLRRAEIDLALIPLLLDGEISIDALTFDGVTVNAIVDRTGRGNWETQTTGDDGADTTTTGESTGDNSLTLDIEEMRLLNVAISYIDEQEGAEYRVDIPRFVTGAVTPGSPARAEFSLSVSDVAGGMSMDLTGNGQLTLAENFESVSFNSLVIDQRLRLPDMPLIRADLNLEGTYNIASSLLTTSLDGQFDETTVSGKASVDTSGRTTGITFELALGPLNADRYLGSESVAQTPFAAPPADVEILPLETLRALDLQGSVSIAALDYSGYAFTDFNLDLTNRSNQLTADISLKGYGGNATVSFDGSTAGRGAGKTTARVSGFDIQQFTEFEWLTGKLDLESDTTFTGNMLTQVLASLDGPTRFKVVDGTLDVRPVKRIAAFIDTLRGQPSKVAQWPDMMPFKNMNGEHRFSGGARTNQQLRFNLEVLDARGTGGFDYFANTMAYDLVLSLSENEGPFSVGPGLARVQWPLHCEGALDASPAELCLPDRAAIQKVITSAATEELKRKGTEVIREKLGEGLKKLFGN